MYIIYIIYIHIYYCTDALLDRCRWTENRVGKIHSLLDCEFRGDMHGRVKNIRTERIILLEYIPRAPILDKSRVSKSA